MVLYRIVREKFAYKLKASGYQNSWNKDGQFVVYTSESRALACLENLVHRGQYDFDNLFKVMIIHVPDSLSMQILLAEELPKTWNSGFCQKCLEIGAFWYFKKDYPILKVPSSIIPNDWNYILNTNHPEFNKISLKGTEDFIFDRK